ncbi:hypothetical protein IAU60_003682 [Kwoniella sp. DSM 27419]
MVATSRRVSYILPTPDTPPPLLSLPSLGQSKQGHSSPFFLPRAESDANNGSSTPLGSRNPFLSPAAPSPSRSSGPQHPRHCLGITSLALDTSTVLSDASSPGGILYTGGRDGLVASWELGVPHRKRRGARYETLPGRGSRVKWERIGDGAEFFDDDELEESTEDDDAISSDEETEGWVGVGKKPKGEVPYEDRWEVDAAALAESKPPPTTFRQSAQTHTDWVNAMLLCNYNQTVVTASSDRTIRAWTPHASSDDPAKLSPSLVGSHRDYVRALAWAKYPGLLFSGALDRHLSIWDIQANMHEPVFNIDLTKADEYGGAGLEGERGSVYSLGVDNAGQVLAAGTPERVVRLWDPRAGDRSIGKLIGHTDCVRSILLSEDGRYMLTGSSDTTIKLWSLAAHRCLHTFNHHDSSVWALHSTHPNLERFYSGSRDGYLCVTDVEQCADISDGECVVLAQDGESQARGRYESKTGDEGIRCITAMDDEYVWTATGSAEIRRWRDVGRRTNRLDTDLEGASYANANGNRRVSADGGDYQNGMADETYGGTQATNGQPGPASPASALPSALRDRLQLSPTHQRTTSIISGASVATSVMSDDDALPDGTASRRGIPYQSLVCLGVPDSPYGFGDSHDRGDEYDERSGGEMGSPINRVTNGSLRPDGEGSARHISFISQKEPSAAQRARMEFEDREVASDAEPLRSTPDEVIAGRSGLIRCLLLNDRQHVLTVDTEGEVAAWNIIKGTCVGRFVAAEVAEALDLERGIKAESAVRKHSQEVLEMVKERVEGETMVITWCQVDTKIGSLVVHLEEGRVFDAEIYADELGLEDVEGIKEDARINLGKWALANLFRGLIKAEEREVTDLHTSTSPSTINSSLPSSMPRSPGLQISIDRAPVAPPHRKRALTGSFSGSKPPSLNIPGLVSPAARRAVLPDDVDESLSLSRSAPEATNYFQSFQALKTPGLSAIPQSPAGSTQPASSPRAEMSSSRDYFSMSMNKKRNDPSPSRESEMSKTPATPGVPQTPGGSFMGKLKGFGKKKQAEAVMAPVAEAEITPEDNGPKFSDRETEQLQILDTVRSHAFHPPPPWEAPFVPYPPSTTLLIAEESKDAGAWVVTYRSQVSSTERDMEALEMNSPLWLLDYLFASRVRTKDPVKFTFILEPAPGSNLKELPEGSARLSASRVLRAKKISAFIADKLDLVPQARARAGSLPHIRRLSAHNIEFDGQPEEMVELLCNNNLVNPNITLATLKAYYGSGPDMLLHYRLKQGLQV